MARTQTNGRESGKDTDWQTYTSSSSLAWAYTELGCTPGDSVEAIKKKYRTAVKQYHPHRLRGQGLPPQAQEKGEKKFLAIQRAYEALINAQ